jgi:outer membrane protein assembly factor BamB
MQRNVSSGIIWQEFIDPESNMLYYLNVETGNVKWETPADPFLPAENIAGSVDDDDDE